MWPFVLWYTSDLLITSDHLWSSNLIPMYGTRMKSAHQSTYHVKWFERWWGRERRARSRFWWAPAGSVVRWEIPHLYQSTTVQLYWDAITTMDLSIQPYLNLTIRFLEPWLMTNHWWILANDWRLCQLMDGFLDLIFVVAWATGM